MTGGRLRLVIIGIIMAVGIAGFVMSLREIRQINEARPDKEDVLYFSSSERLKRLSLGYSGLLANIYWTRAVQYFGSGRLARSTHFDLLYPLLDIATDLDPELIVAYQDGAVFLSAPIPGGAGQPDKAVDLLEKGIRSNPKFWRLYFTLGFVQYIDRKDYKAAREAFERGSQVPGAQPWMKVMAATMAQHAGERDTAMAIWSRLYESAHDPDIRANALKHLTALRIDMAVTQLDSLVRLFRDRNGRLPSGWMDLVRARLLRGIPLDPEGQPYRLTSDGEVLVEHPEDFPFITEGVPQAKEAMPQNH